LPHPGGESGCDALRAALERLRQFDLHCSALRDPGACAACGNCPDLAELLDAVAQDAARLSDRLAMRYFTHVGDVGRPTLAA